ncbi:hypothetical protein L3X38_004897 [Prunus dulcis]|uniref:Uncharacterized protein n=1 Tax=Prunus dulcis TaxID=3755 RepID=A0AAD5F3I9_PRUDU|nr:hypothetical protein L3X38_004897 [Prunus dulcis]
MATYVQNLSNQNLLNPSYAGDEKLASYPEPPAKMMMYLKQASYATGSYSEVLSGGSFSPHKYAYSDGGRNEMMLLASKLFPFAFAIVSGETMDNWRWFLQRISDVLLEFFA